MNLHPIDYTLIACYFAFVLMVGVLLERRARSGLSEFFLSGRDMPWWLIGTSMVATTFGAGTPLLVAGWARDYGIARNWEWWCYLLGAMLTTFFFAKLWSRTAVMTDAELLELRYSGKPARILRGFRALYMGFLMNTLVMGSQLVAIGKIGHELLGVSRWTVAIISGTFALFYCAMSGLRGVVITDFAQFAIAMISSVALCVCALGHDSVGGLSGLVEKLQQTRPEVLHFVPHGQQAVLPISALIAFLTIRWWSTVYGGAEPGGASHVAQRMLAARSEKDALLGTLWFNIAHYAVRPWPWILTGLATILIFPAARDGEAAYVAAVRLLPVGLKGVMVAAFFAAFMSTIDTRLNLGAAYLVNDFYKRFIAPEKSQRHYVFVSRLVTIVQIVLAYLMMLIVEDLRSVFYIYTAIGAGSGLVLILRWYWWRVNAWSEIAGMSLSLLMILIFRAVIWRDEQQFNQHAVEVLLISTAVVTAGWILVTLITKPTSEECLKRFYRKVRPVGLLWGHIARELREEGLETEDDPRAMLVGWVAACLMVFCVLFATGKFLLGSPSEGVLYSAAALPAVAALVWSFRRI